MPGYVRTDTSDQIADGNVVDAIPLDTEFDALQSAFAVVGGHSHNGMLGEGSPITTLGPTQNVTVSSNSISPKVTNNIDLGSATYQFKDFWLDGVANIDSLIADTADINAGTIDDTTIGATTPAPINGTVVTATTGFVGSITGNVTGNVTGTHTGNVVGNVTGNLAGVVTGSLVGNSSTATTLQTGRTISLSGGATGSVSFNGGSDVTIPVTIANNSHNHLLSNVTDAGTMAAQNSTSVTITGGTISGITDLAISDGGTGASTAIAARANLGLTTQTSFTDTTTDVLLKVGAFGLGNASTANLLPNMDATDIAGGDWRYDGTTTGTKPAGANAVGSVQIIRGAGGNSFAQVVTDYNGLVFTRSCLSGVFGSWSQMATTAMVAATMPKAASAAGAGQFTYIGAAANSSLYVPSGGQWAVYFNAINTSGAVIATAASIYAGGTLLYGATASVYTTGFAWRIS